MTELSYILEALHLKVSYMILFFYLLFIVVIGYSYCQNFQDEILDRIIWWLQYLLLDFFLMNSALEFFDPTEKNAIYFSSTNKYLGVIINPNYVK